MDRLDRKILRLLQEDSTLGDEFYTESGIGGFLTGENGNKSVESLYAGINCFFR